MKSVDMPRPPLPPFTLATAREKVQKAEDAWNSCEPDRAALAYTGDSVWRNRADFFSGWPMIREFLRRKWARELDYRLKKEPWAFTGNHISVRFEYKWHDDAGFWFCSHSNEQWEFDALDLMQRRESSINDVPIKAADRRFHWPHPLTA